jgi:hypothetical protein
VVVVEIERLPGASCADQAGDLSQVGEQKCEPIQQCSGNAFRPIKDLSVHSIRLGNVQKGGGVLKLISI